MGTGTLVKSPGLTRQEVFNNTVDSTHREATSTEEQLQQQMLDNLFGQEVYFRGRDTYYADINHYKYASRGYSSGTSQSDWGGVPISTSEPATIWDSAKFIELLSMPIGSPVELTFEEADEIVRLAAGRRPDLPSGKEYEKEVRELLGHSLIDRIEKAE